LRFLFKLKTVLVQRCPQTKNIRGKCFQESCPHSG